MRALRPVGGTRRFTLPGSPLLSGLLLLCAAAVASLPINSQAQDLSPREQPYEIPAQGLAEALIAYSDQSGVQVVTSGYDLVDRDTAGISGTYTAATALDALLAGSGMEYRIVGESTVALTDPNAPPISLAPAEGDVAGEGAGGFGDGNATNVAEARRAGVEEIIVTGQKKEERLQDVPIAISAFSMEQLDAQKIEGGFDLLKAIPNVTFSKTNFTSYNFQIRGVGTQSISATSDPGVTVSFNSTAIIQNRLFEQEYLDVERVEVLRGPQGTLFGRNATAGVINVISHKPDLGEWGGEIDIEIGNYQTRRMRGMFNVPVGDTFAFRGAYAFTGREGYTYNSGTERAVDGRDLWTGRLSAAWQPADKIRIDLVWERFEEDDSRLRTGKQLCHRDDGPATVGGVQIVDGILPANVKRAFFGQGCKPGSLYSNDAYGTPNGLSYNFVLGTLALRDVYTGVGRDADGVMQTVIAPRDPYGGKTQSTDLREIESILDPRYVASADLIDFGVKVDLSDSLQLVSSTTHVDDETYSFQDYNRFNTDPIFTDTSKLTPPGAGNFSTLAPGGIFCDPQLGCSDAVAGFDIAQAKAKQFSQEFRLQSNFDSNINYSFGVNYTEFESLVDYYIMFNLISAMSMIGPFNFGGAALNDVPMCAYSDFGLDVVVNPPVPVPLDDPRSVCPYIDPNAIAPGQNFQGEGHNYYRSKNPYKLESWASFGELYWNLREDLKITLGLRYTKDQKTFTPVPTQVLLAPGLIGGGTVAKGYPEEPDIIQKWGEWTGRMVVDWKPVLGFTDETLMYVSLSRGYKGGGVNPPKPGYATLEQNLALIEESGLAGSPLADALINLGVLPVLQLTADEYRDTFEPEFVNAFELGMKNTMLDGALMLNMSAFFYDYEDYQVSQIRDRTAVNENFDARIWGLELEAVFAPSPSWQFLANLGYLDTKIASGERSIDIINRTQRDPEFTIVKPWVQLPSNCVAPTTVAAQFLQQNPTLSDFVGRVLPR